jgi:aspartokinase
VGAGDFSGAIIAAALDADALWIMTDVNGVMTGDPRVVKSARTLATITFREVSELAYYGAKVLHPKTIRPVIGTKTQLWVKNTFDPDGPSTLIVTEDSAASENIIRAVTAIQKQTMITIEGRGMIGVQGIAGRTFQAVAHANASVSLITQASSEQSICFTTNSSDAKPALAALHDEFARELARQDIDKISVLADVVIITVVSAKMRNTPGIAGVGFQCLGQRRGQHHCHRTRFIRVQHQLGDQRHRLQRCGSSHPCINRARITPPPQTTLKDRYIMTTKRKVAVLGATGTVGQRFIQLLDKTPLVRSDRPSLGPDRTVGGTYRSGMPLGYSRRYA